MLIQQIILSLHFTILWNDINPNLVMVWIFISHLLIKWSIPLNLKLYFIIIDSLISIILYPSRYPLLTMMNPILSSYLWIVRRAFLQYIHQWLYRLLLYHLSIYDHLFCWISNLVHHLFYWKHFRLLLNEMSNLSCFTIQLHPTIWLIRVVQALQSHNV